MSRASWTTQAEAAIRSLRDVEGASIQLDGEEIREIHVLTRSSRSPKQIVRDVQTVLLTRFQRAIDYRVVSVAYSRAQPGSPVLAAVPPPAAEPLAVRDEARVRFASVNLYVEGPRTQAQVELKWKGLVRLGTAAGWSTRAAANRLVAEATLAGMQEFLEGDVALALQEVAVVDHGRHRVALVTVALVAHRQEKILVGGCTIEEDVPQAVALATLAAVNRVLGGLPLREPTEFVVRPTST